MAERPVSNTITNNLGLDNIYFHAFSQQFKQLYKGLMQNNNLRICLLYLKCPYSQKHGCEAKSHNEVCLIK